MRSDLQGCIGKGRDVPGCTGKPGSTKCRDLLYESNYTYVYIHV